MTALEDWIGRSETRTAVIDAESLRRYAAAVDAPLEVERHPPPLGQWAFFNEVVAPDRIGEDGHPRRGGFLPPVELPRRMFAQSALRFQAPMAIGEVAELHMQIADVRRRTGRSGELVLVEVDRTLVQDGAPRITERQTIAYRQSGEPTPPVSPADDIARADDEVWSPTSADLFRFSAATFNSHRIHYDKPYAMDVEGYPGLLVHGPFTAAKLCALATGIAGKPLKSFNFRAQSPLFEGQEIRLRPGDEPSTVAAIRCDGAVAMTATFEA
ncbi:MAG: MaoC family dehydratase N-terminal domain-containing protein [Caulobacterales bacterium]